MSATINVLCPQNEDSIEMYVDPEERIEEVEERCQSYWQLEDESDEYVLIRGDTELASGKTVISSDLQDGDVVRYLKKEKLEKKDNGKKESLKLKPKEILSLAQKWLKDNIGVESDNLELVERESRQSGTNLQFKNTDREEHYTVVVEGKKVKTYIPALMDDVELEKV